MEKSQPLKTREEEKSAKRQKSKKNIKQILCWFISEIEQVVVVFLLNLWENCLWLKYGWVRIENV